MRLASLLIILSLMAGCKSGPDAYLCSVIVTDGDGAPLLEPYAFCKHYITKEEKRVLLINTQGWVSTDPTSYENLRNWYKGRCSNGN